MKASILGLAGAAALASLPAVADHRHHHGHVHSHVSVGFTWGHPFHGWYAYHPSFYSVGVHLWPTWPVYPYPASRTRTEREERAFKLYVYPAGGQSEQQMADDRYDCHVWAVDESGHDPTLGMGRREEADAYRRAFTACMEGRNYVVR
ncbi:MAG TPA: hypothetical protein VIN61_02050 [Gammaproteobacteria bacterium]